VFRRQYYDALIAGLPLEDKVRLLTGASMFTLHGEQRVGLDPMAFSDGPAGVRGVHFAAGEAVALLPNATVLASTWRTDLAHEAGVILAEEAIRQRIHVVLGPTVNLHRSPLGGRLFAQYSEDPLLTGRIAAAYVRGLQSRGVGACLKHLVANESETDRAFVDVRVSVETLREVYLMPFQIAVEDAQPWSIMAAYNRVNGVAATEHGQVNDGILRGEWGWDGLLMSDWFATRTSAPAANGGLDLVMPGPSGPWGAALVSDVHEGRVPEATVDEHLRRVLRLADRVGALRPYAEAGRRPWDDPTPAPESPERSAQLRRLATDGMVVLENSGALPLAADLRIALIGRHAVDTVCMGGGSATVNPPHQVSLAEGLAQTYGARLTVVDGVDVRAVPLPASPMDVVDPVTGGGGVHLRWHDAEGDVLAERHESQAQLGVGLDDDFPRPATRVVIRARLRAAGPVRLGVIGTGAWALAVDGEQVFADTLGPVGRDPGEALIKPPAATFVIRADAGALVEADLRLVALTPVPDPDGTISPLGEAMASGIGVKGLIAGPAPRPLEEVIEDAVAAARTADVAVIAVGLTSEQETESRDKATLRLPAGQDRLVQAVAATARRTVVVVNAATPVLMPWAAQVDAILVAGLPGQEGGAAIADALTGVREPAGRLVTSWPVADAATPAWQVAPNDLALDYVEGSCVGYRGHHAGLAPPPAYWFGHGLGYGRWRYGGARLVVGAPVPTAEVTVRNLAEHGSREVVQAYFLPAEPGQPVRLVGWSVVEVAAGASVTVTVAADPRLMRRWDAGAETWAGLSGGELLLARGLGDVRARLKLG